MKKYLMSCLLVVSAIGLQGCASQKELIGMGAAKNFSVEGRGNWQQTFRDGVIKSGGVVTESATDHLSAEVKNHRVKVVVRLVQAGTYDVSGAMLANDLKSFYSLTDDAHDATKEIADYMGAHGFSVKEAK
jgi:hypothetical protein